MLLIRAAEYDAFSQKNDPEHRATSGGHGLPSSTAVGGTDRDVFDIVGNIVAGRRPCAVRMVLGWRGRVGEHAQCALAFAANEAATLIGDAGLTPHHSRLRRVQCEEDDRKRQNAAHGPIPSSGRLLRKAADGFGGRAARYGFRPLLPFPFRRRDRR
jgi:hypothetical protein